MRKATGWIVAVSLPLVAIMLVAQERREPAPARAPAAGREPAPGLRDPARPPAERDAPRAGAAAQVTRSDQEIAAVKLACCRVEVELAKLASQKAQSDEVKQFAAKMVKDHTEACANLEKWAGALAAASDRGDRAAPGDRREGDERRDTAPRTTPAAPGAAAPGADVEVRVPPGGRPGADVTVRGAPAGGGLNWVAVQQQIADQCLATAKKEFSQKEAEDFDKCFMGMAIGGHQHAIDADHVFMNHASPQFRGELEDCLKMATAHLNEAKDIMQKLEGKAPRLTRKPE